jgi:hypothetical protein
MAGVDKFIDFILGGVATAGGRNTAKCSRVGLTSKLGRHPEAERPRNQGI